MIVRLLSSIPRRFFLPLTFAFFSFLLLSASTFRLEEPEENALGLVGYYVAYGLFYLLGVVLYPLLVFLLYRAYEVYRKKRLGIAGWEILYLLCAGISLSILLSVLVDRVPGCGAFCGRNLYQEIFYYPTEPTVYYIKYFLGGVPAYILYQEAPSVNLIRLFGRLGSTLIFASLFLISTTLLCNLQWGSYLSFVMQGFGHFFRVIWNLLKKILPSTQKKIPPSQNILEEELPPAFPSPYLHRQSSPKLPPLPPPPLHRPISAPKPIISALRPPLVSPLLSPSVVPQVHLAGRQAAAIALGDDEAPSQVDSEIYQLPPATLLRAPRIVDDSSLRERLQQQAETLRETLLNFGIEASVGDIHCGPRITSFEVHPAVGVKVQKIKALENDIALNMQAPSIRIIAPIPGKAAVGIEIPSPIPQEVSFRQLVEEYQRGQHHYHVPILLGKNVSGQFVGCDLTKMPHAIIAGATGSGKSVCINTLVMSIIMNASPDEIKLLMVDPKKVELTPYSNLPHMLAPVITEPHEAFAALTWLVREMEFRYEILKRLGFRNIVSFNERTRDLEAEEQTQLAIPEKMYYIVAIIDELADLMMVANQDIETPIARIAQMARAVGIHMVIATQRPSREVLTGLIKANFPTRIAFKVASRVNSQIILDEIGAETLLGNGDMLFLPPGTSSLIRAQGAYISDEEIQSVIKFILAQRSANYLIKEFGNEVETVGNWKEGSSSKESQSEQKNSSLYEEAFQLVMETGNASASFLQRHLRVGYPTAANLIDQLESAGVISQKERGNRPRRVLGRSSKDDSDEE